MRHIFSLATILTLALTFLSCSGGKKDDGTITPPVPTDGRVVYLVGADWDGVNGILTVWKNREKQILQNNYTNASNYDYTKIESLFASNNKVYVLGYVNFYGNTPQVQCLWVDGVPQKLDMDEASSVFVSGNDVYVAGSYDAGTLVPGTNDRKWNACIWKNGVRQDLNTGRGSSNALSVAVSGNDVYVVGDNDANAQLRGGAALWKNGVLQNLKDADDTEVYAVFVFGDDVYVGGSGKNDKYLQSIVWKNGSIYQRLNNVYIRYIFVE